MWVDQLEENTKYFPLSHLKNKKGLFDAFNSPLSEFAVLGFDFGYSLFYPHSLIIWEAQYGDFAKAQDFERLMQLSTGMIVTAALQPIARLKIPDLLADGPHQVSQLAAETDMNEDALYRIMRMLASVGVFAELPGKVFAITPCRSCCAPTSPAPCATWSSG